MVRVVTGQTGLGGVGDDWVPVPGCSHSMGKVSKAISCKVSGLGGVLFENSKKHKTKSMLMMVAMVGLEWAGYCRPAGLR